MKAASLRKHIRFDCHPVFSKWGKPNIYGSGKLYDLTLKESKCQHKSTGPSLLTYNPSIALPLCTKVEALNKPTHLDYRRHIIDLEDGGKVGVDEVTDRKAPQGVDYPNILYMPSGLTTSHSPRSKIWASWFLDAGYPRVFILNQRCTSRVLQYSPQISIPYGKYNDIPGVVDYLVDYLPNEKWIIIGSCFGSTFVLNYFSQPSSYRSEVLGGIVDSFQFNGKKYLEGHYKSKSWLFKVARSMVMKMFVDVALKHSANQDVYDQVSQLFDRERFKGIDFSTVQSCKLVYEELLCKLCPDAPFQADEEYFALTYPYFDQSHEKNFLRIKKPITLIYAQDDPLCSFDSEMIETLKENENICLWLYPGGGHICFNEKIFPYTSYLKDVYLENAGMLKRNQGQM